MAAAGRDFLSRRPRRLHTAFHLCPSSTLLAWDLLCLGRPVIGESFSHGALSNRLEVWMDDAPLLIERLHLADGRLASVAQYPWVGTLLFYPASEALLDGVRERLTTLGNYAGATLTDGLLTVRFLSDDNLLCQRAMRDIWQLCAASDRKVPGPSPNLVDLRERYGTDPQRERQAAVVYRRTGGGTSPGPRPEAELPGSRGLNQRLYYGRRPRR